MRSPVLVLVIALGCSPFPAAPLAPASSEDPSQQRQHRQLDAMRESPSDDETTVWSALIRPQEDGVPAIDGRVLAVQSPALVLLNVGTDARVQPGYRFSVYRGSCFVGKVAVESVTRDSSGCRVLFSKAGERILPGDAVATRLE